MMDYPDTVKFVVKGSKIIFSPGEKE